MSGSQICADMHLNPTLTLRYGPNKAARPDKPGHLWAPCDWQSFIEAATLYERAFIGRLQSGPTCCHFEQRFWAPGHSYEPMGCVK